jgi:hypothetical protein
MFFELLFKREQGSLYPFEKTKPFVLLIRRPNQARTAWRAGSA